MVRSHNEDSIAADPANGLVVLADGMGGYNAGEVASGIAVKVVADGMLPPLKRGTPLGKVDIASGHTHAAQMLQQYISLANKSIFDAATARPECAGMGTTLVVALFYESRVCVAHVGDSRCYRLRGDRLEQLNKNLVTRALGIEALVPPDISEYRLEAGDIYVLCSDGLTDMVEPDSIRTTLVVGRGNLAQAAQQLVDAANQNGGRDNVSVVLVRIPDGYLAKPDWIREWKQKPDKPVPAGKPRRH
jgi:protein phosphatase